MLIASPGFKIYIIKPVLVQDWFKKFNSFVVISLFKGATDG